MLVAPGSTREFDASPLALTARLWVRWSLSPVVSNIIKINVTNFCTYRDASLPFVIPFTGCIDWSQVALFIRSARPEQRMEGSQPEARVGSDGRDTIIIAYH